MQKQEFEERIERTVTDEQYKVIEEVYMWHPSIRNTSGKSFAFDNIIDEQRDMLKETVEEYPAITISLADKLLRMLGLADTTSVKKL